MFVPSSPLLGGNYPTTLGFVVTKVLSLQVA
jgi:hypothetical protein